MKTAAKHLVAALTALGILAFLSCAGTSEKKQEERREGQIHLQMGSNYLNNDNIEMAHFELSKAVRLLPRDPEAHFALGTVYLKREEPELAAEEFKTSISLDDSHADAYNNLCFSYLKMGLWDESIETCQKALELVNYDTPERAMSMIGWAYYKKGDPVRALEILNRALRIRDNQPDTENKIAAIYLEEGRIDKAKTILRNLVKRAPNFINARLNMGIVYYKEKDVLAARREFKAVLELAEDGSEEARLARGYLDLIE